MSRAVLVDRVGATREPVGGFPFRRFGAHRARALIRLLHGGGLVDRLKAVRTLIWGRA